MILLHVRLFIVQETSRNVACTIPKMTRISKNIIFMKDNNYLSTRVALLNTSVLFPTQHGALPHPACSFFITKPILAHFFPVATLHQSYFSPAVRLNL